MSLIRMCSWRKNAQKTQNISSQKINNHLDEINKKLNNQYDEYKILENIYNKLKTDSIYQENQEKFLLFDLIKLNYTATKILTDSNKNDILKNYASQFVQKYNLDLKKFNLQKCFFQDFKHLNSVNLFEASFLLNTDLNKKKFSEILINKSFNIQKKDSIRFNFLDESISSTIKKNIDLNKKNIDYFNELKNNNKAKDSMLKFCFDIFSPPSFDYKNLYLLYQYEEFKIKKKDSIDDLFANANISNIINFVKNSSFYKILKIKELQEIIDLNDKDFLYIFFKTQYQEFNIERFLAIYYLNQENFLEKLEDYKNEIIYNQTKDFKQLIEKIITIQTNLTNPSFSEINSIEIKMD